ncbi:hypothetical protein VTN77DRAFT_7425 [Rasamsonia byssochlamydoides]|uniref:uncharacterized protein n=1 Tax=Rasamsonia byssochlamydoides TaxID=89139 RepID=UPI0037441179
MTISSPCLLIPDAADYIFSLTSGHPGAVNGILSMPKKAYRSDLKHQKIQVVEKAHIIEILNDEEKSFRYLAQTGVQRLFVNGEVAPQTLAVLQEVLFNNSIPRNLENEGIRECYEKDMWNTIIPIRLFTGFPNAAD